MTILVVALEGRILAGRYRLISQLGRGGMGSVWRAEHIDLATPAAVKLIDESFAQSTEALTRFRREAQAAASLRSANVVQILDYGIDGETPFIAMELLEGESLADRLERQSRLEPIDCATILLQVSKALSRAHDLGIVHRDLKPDNVFLVREGDDEIAKVLDFGIAKRTSTLQTSADMATRTGSLMGTPYYMSPEQASGRRQVDHRTDIWAFSVIAYECLVGQRPFDDNNLGGLLLNICTESPRMPSSVGSVPLGFDEWFQHCTVKEPSGRFASIREAAIELCRICGVVVPASRLGSMAQLDGAAPQRPDPVQSVTSPWKESGSSVSVLTPGGVVRTNELDDADAARQPSTLEKPKAKPPLLLVLSGIVAGLGLLSAVTAGALRYMGAGGTAPAAAVASNETVVVGSPASAVVVAPIASQTALPTDVAVAVGGPIAVPAASVPAAETTPPIPRARGAVRPPAARRPPQPAARPAEVPRLQPRDRLERDLGF